VNPPGICIWKIKGMKTLQHRIIWWMVDAGAAGHCLMHGWQIEAAKQLNIHRITLYRQVQLMLDLKILFEGKNKGEVILNTDIFKPLADTRRIKKERVL
jgi:hypothetical protein